jgi:atypical dual specificity phosphatase
MLARAAFLPTLLWNILLCRVLRRANWWDVVDEGLIVGALPLRSDVAKLSANGVRAVVNMCQEYAGPTSAYAQWGIEQLHLPTLDFTPPTFQSVMTAVDYIERKRGEGAAIYVHCKAGRGRSATIAMCWIMKTRKLSPQEAFRHLKDRRPRVDRDLPNREVVRRFWQTCCGGAAGHATIASHPEPGPSL